MRRTLVALLAALVLSANAAAQAPPTRKVEPRPTSAQTAAHATPGSLERLLTQPELCLGDYDLRNVQLVETYSSTFEGQPVTIVVVEDADSDLQTDDETNEQLVIIIDSGDVVDAARRLRSEWARFRAHLRLSVARSTRSHRVVARVAFIDWYDRNRQVVATARPRPVVIEPVYEGDGTAGGIRSTGAPITTGTSSSGTSGTVHVRGYTRRDGTYVRPHTRSAPRSRRP